LDARLILLSCVSMYAPVWSSKAT